MLIYYNCDMFECVGIIVLLVDFEFFLVVGVVLCKVGLVLLVLLGGFFNMLGNGFFSYGFVNQIVVKVFDWCICIVNGILQLDNVDGVVIFVCLCMLVEQKMVQVDCLCVGYDMILCQFVEGCVVMIFQGSWVVGMLMNVCGMWVGVFVLLWNDKGQLFKLVLGSEIGFVVVQCSGVW